MECEFKNKKIFNKNFLFFSLSIIILLFIICGFIYNSYLVLIGLVLYVVSIFLLQQDKHVCILILLFPFASIFKLSPTSTSLFTVCEIITLIYLFLKTKKISKYILIGVLFYAIYLLFGHILYGNLDILEIIKQISNILLLYYLIRTVKFKNINIIFWSFIVGIILSSILASFGDYIPHFSDYMEIKELSTLDGKVLRFSGLQGDPNYYSVNVIVSLFLVVFMYINKNINIITFWPLFFILTVFGIQTLSKSFILTYLPILLFFIIDRIKKIKFADIFIISLAVIIIYSMLLNNNSSLNIIYERFKMSDSIDKLTTGRSSIFITYLNYIFNNLHVFLFGVGLTGQLLNEIGTHNLYVEILYYLGVLGVSIVVYNYYLCLCYKKLIRRCFLNYLGIFVLCMMYMFLQGLFNYALIFQVFMVFLTYNTSVLKSKNNELKN